MPTILEQYRISDFLEWHNQKRLIINSDFQRGSVWTPAARAYLIDTILRELPIPKIYLRTNIDINTKKSIREVVDGQQRLRAIIDFSNDKITLPKRTGEFSGLKYSTLNEELKNIFLNYPLAVDQLVNATDNHVLEVFSRLNSYSVPLNSQERRHAKYQGGFKWAVNYVSKKWSKLWEGYKVFTVRERVRMQDDSLVAEMFGVLLEGVADGGQKNIDRLYERYDDEIFEESKTIDNLNKTLNFIFENIAEDLYETTIFRPTHFLMLFAAVAHSQHGIPKGGIIKMPQQKKINGKKINVFLTQCFILKSCIKIFID